MNLIRGELHFPDLDFDNQLLCKSCPMCMPRAYSTSCSAFSFNSVAPDDISVELLSRLPLVFVFTDMPLIRSEQFDQVVWVQG